MIAISVILVLLAILGAPLFAVIATSAMVGFHREETDLMNMALEIQSIADLPFLAAIPLFTFAGYLLSESNAPARLVRVTNALCLAGCPVAWHSCVWLACLRLLHGIHRRVGGDDHRARRNPLSRAQAGWLR